MERARARVVADQEYLRAALEHIRADLGGWIGAPQHARPVHPVGVRHSDPLHRHQRPAGDRRSG